MRPIAQAEAAELEQRRREAEKDMEAARRANTWKSIQEDLDREKEWRDFRVAAVVAEIKKDRDYREDS